MPCDGVSQVHAVGDVVEVGPGEVGGIVTYVVGAWVGAVHRLHVRSWIEHSRPVPSTVKLSRL